MEAMTPAKIKDWVALVRAEYFNIEKREWNRQSYGLSHAEMWVDASKIAPEGWQEIIRVLAQGGNYYEIEW